MYEDSGHDASIQKELGHCQLNFILHGLWFKFNSETLHLLYSQCGARGELCKFVIVLCLVHMISIYYVLEVIFITYYNLHFISK